MTKEQAALRGMEVLREIDEHKIARKHMNDQWKMRLEELVADLRMCQADIDGQMRIGEEE